MNILNQFVADKYACYNGDSCEVVKEIPDNSIHYTLFSPPFSSLYTYSNSDRDMGNSKGDDEFFKHFEFLVKELYRVTMPGRLLSFHCMNIPLMKERDGVIGLKDFRGDLIRVFQSQGFVYHSEVTIWKNPVTEMQRTKALGLLHKQIKKDSAMSRQGIPDYIVTMSPGLVHNSMHRWITSNCNGQIWRSSLSARADFFCNVSDCRISIQTGLA